LKLKHQLKPTPKRLRGCKSGVRRKFTDEQANEIRQKYEDVELASTVTLAKEYGVNTSTIRSVIHYLGAYANV